MHFGFSYVGLIFMAMLFIPNIIWTKNQPQNYEKYACNENKILLLFERVGEVSVTCLMLIFKDLNFQGVNTWMVWFLLAAVLMVLYEIYWIRYFRSDKTMKDYYSSILGVPVAGATLPVVAVLLLAIYARNPILFAAGVILGIGHIGIHVNHYKEAMNEMTESYDPAFYQPVVKASICNGEQVAGFKNIQTGEIEEVMLIRTPGDWETFKKRYNITGEIEKIY